MVSLLNVVYTSYTSPNPRSDSMLFVVTAAAAAAAAADDDDDDDDDDVDDDINTFLSIPLFSFKLSQKAATVANAYSYVERKRIL